MVTLVVLAGTVGVGVLTTMAQTFPSPPPADGVPVTTRPTSSGHPYTVAVVLGTTGSVAADALIPYEVFARSPQFSVHTVARTRDPVTLSGGFHVVPDRTFATDTQPPDVVVVPAVADPAGAGEAPLRAWVTAQAEAGSHVLAVCAGSAVLAATGLLDGRTATSHWERVGPLARAYPDVHWVRGERYVEAGPVTTTGGITSGAAGALRVLERLAGPDEAARVGADLGYPGWSLDGDTRIPAHHRDAVDVPFWLSSAFPWSRPTIALALRDGVGEADVAVAAEVYSGGSFAARTVPVSADGAVTTGHGLVVLTDVADGQAPRVDRVVAPGAEGFTDVDPLVAAWAAARRLPVEMPEAGAGGGFAMDAYLLDLARTADRATARATAKYTEYPVGHLDLAGPAWPWRPTALLVAAVLVSVGSGWLAAAAVDALMGRRPEAVYYRQNLASTTRRAREPSPHRSRGGSDRPVGAAGQTRMR